MCRNIKRSLTSTRRSRRTRSGPRRCSLCARSAASTSRPRPTRERSTPQFQEVAASVAVLMHSLRHWRRLAIALKRRKNVAPGQSCGSRATYTAVPGRAPWTPSTRSKQRFGLLEQCRWHAWLGRCGVLIDLLRARGTDDRRGDVRLAAAPRQARTVQAMSPQLAASAFTACTAVEHRGRRAIPD